MTIVRKDIFEDIDLATFYHFIFGKGWCQKNQTGKTFYVNYSEELGNFNIEVVKTITSDPPPFLRIIDQISIDDGISIDPSSDNQPS